MYINIYMIVGYALTIVSKLENHFNQRFSTTIFCMILSLLNINNYLTEKINDLNLKDLIVIIGQSFILFILVEVKLSE